MRKLITFIGTGNYQPTRYTWRNQLSEPTKFFPVALVEWLNPDQIIVMLTEVAEQGPNWSECRSNLDPSKTRPVRIPDGKDENQLWEIFRIITEQVEPGDEIILDITHGFRSLPVLGLLALAYLRQVKGAHILHLLYGAHEARDGEHTPVFDLTPFLSLLDWLGAVKMFMETGNGHPLAELLKRTQNQAWISQKADAPRELKSMGSALEEVSDALLLSRVPLIDDAVERFATELSRAKPEIEQWAPPLVPMLEQIATAHSAYREGDHLAQVRLAEWYLEHGHLLQAVTLMREWIVSQQVLLMGDDISNKDARDNAEAWLNKALHKEIPHSETPLIPLWSKAVNLRNDLAHCGFGREQEQVLQPTSIKQQTSELLNLIRKHTSHENTH
ncbi:MAG: TIGR02221 family CRISPR-associated protein [Fimbriimonadales bacterium]